MKKAEFELDQALEEMMRAQDLDTIVILGHMNPDGDAAGSVMGIAHYIKVNYPQYSVHPYLADTLDKGPKKMVSKDLCFDPFHKPNLSGKRYAAIVCDTATMKRMVGLALFEGAVSSIVIDHHASNEGYGDVNQIQISEACSENVFYMLRKEHLSIAAKEAHPNAADYIYLGLLHDTGGFARAKVTSMKAAAELMDLGVDHKEMMKTLQTDTYEDLLKRAELLKRAVRVMDGQVAYIVIDRNLRTEWNIEYEDIRPISGILRDCEDICLAATMYEQSSGVWRCSFRSDGRWLNVNHLLSHFGGGGHAAAAGLRVETDDIEGLIERFLNQIKKMRSIAED